MKTYIFYISSILLFLTRAGYSQCDIKNKVMPDGTLVYFIKADTFYYTDNLSLKGGITTDKEHYFLNIYPNPIPEKNIGKKIKDDLILKLANDSTYTLKHFDSRYLENDSIFEILYLIDRKDIDKLKSLEAISITINMLGLEGNRTYVLKLHKKILMEQITCFEDKIQEK